METLVRIYKHWLSPYTEWEFGGWKTPDIYMEGGSSPKCNLYWRYQVLIEKVPDGWVLEFLDNPGFPHKYAHIEEARKAALMWIFQGLWDPI